jgi:hypothetical protein
MIKFLGAFITTIVLLWSGVDDAAGVRSAEPTRWAPTHVEKKIVPLKIPANSCIVSDEERGLTLKQYVLRCNNRHQWLNINFDDGERPEKTKI